MRRSIYMDGEKAETTKIESDEWKEKSGKSDPVSMNSQSSVDIKYELNQSTQTLVNETADVKRAFLMEISFQRSKPHYILTLILYSILAHCPLLL